MARSETVTLTIAKIREIDVRHAQMQARAVQSVLEHTGWLTAEQIGELGGFSISNLAAPANRWKQERKIFALPRQGQDRFPRYALDEGYRPLPVMESILEALGCTKKRGKLTSAKDDRDSECLGEVAHVGREIALSRGVPSLSRAKNCGG